MSHVSQCTKLFRGFGIAGALAGTFAAGTARAQANNTILGPNVYVFSPSMSASVINAQLNQLNQAAQFSTNRYAVLFEPGSYGTTSSPVTAEVGFYESVAGLGESPSQVTITGGLTADQLINGNMTQNFWRSQENMTVIPTGGLTNGVLDWGVSQGASLRRLNIEGGLELTNSGSVGSTNPCAESSGGFTADTMVSGLMNACSQQQWYTRNSVLNGGFDANVWNFVFSGVLPTNTPPQSYPGGSGGDTNVTNLAKTPVSREKPFLYTDSAGNYNVFVPTVLTNSSGTSWSNGGYGTGYTMPISDFFIATPSSTLTQINSALSSGKSLILTPGVYQYSGPISVTNANTIVLGLGYADIVPQAGTAAISVADVDGVQLAGLLIDAGPQTSSVLVEMGNPGATNSSHASNPSSLNDVFFRIGGATAGSATTSLQVDSGNVILDNIWAWRADHGNSGTVGWTINTAAHGLVVNGANVTALGLAVEHYQQSQVQWNGNGGETIFYQSELPYDPPSQSAWMDGTANGYPSYVVASNVCSHLAYGLGIYSYFDLGVNIVEDNAMTVPNTTGVNVTDVGTVWLGGSGQISNVINGTGGAVNSSYADTLRPVASYLGSGACPGSASTGVYINAGGGAAGSFVADTDYAGGGAGQSTTQAINTSLISGTVAPQAVWQSNHDGVTTYTIPGFTAGSSHTVQLDFAEVYFNATGQRVFNVAINGTTVLSNFDIIAAAGAEYKAVAKSFTANANNSGQIVVSLTNGTANQPEISGIEIH